MVLIKHLFIFFLCSISINASSTDFLYFSNYPESINYPQQIFSENINLENVRFHYYHLNNTPKNLTKSLTISNKENFISKIEIININNSGFDGSKLSFHNSFNYWNLFLNKEHQSISIPPNKSVVISEEVIKPQEISHGIIKIYNPQKSNLLIDLIYEGNIYNSFPKNPIRPVVTKKLIKKDYTILPYGPKVIIPIGHIDKTIYEYNHGNYAQIHELNFKFINPYDYPLESIVYYHRISGMSRNNIIINNKIIQTKYILMSSPVEKIHKFIIPSNSSATHKISLFPESGNFYPIEIVLSSLKKPSLN